MTESKLRAEIAYCEVLEAKHLRLSLFFNAKITDLKQDLWRIQYTLRIPYFR